MKKIFLILALSLFFTGCGAGAGGGVTASAPKLDVKVGGKSVTLDVKSGMVDMSEMVATAPGKPDLKTFLHKIYVANFEMDTSGVAWMNKPLTAPEQVRVQIDLLGEAGTTKESPFKVGTYPAQADKTSGVRSVTILTFDGAKQADARFNSLMGYADKKAAGEVRITAVTADTVSGEVDLTEGDKSIKGNFTAKLPGGKK
jgi:hypothetical protein